ncbi:Strobilurin A biosynthesis cluster protein r1 [Psilocybe cubensis]|uniref:Strobilurin A biosynthesis cluster protein r1 n=1 Tax=Psilocybe cubensis TaxID=181762 RepID=A0ACB8GIQ2_PSICU|nr:Strobilurin A biosynthesis cluster protein r1 [Psilocybe cubensis]KAH9475252.1 Strobilurin A biosynthesis cluster protein r1 [Psilocybe cubensis]
MAPDPVAEKSGFLRMYMSNHPDTLVAYAKWFGKVKEVITSAEMTAIDCNSMTLTCTMKGGSKKEVRVPIEPPLSGYEDVKPRLLEMKAFAQEGLGMIKAPHITTFEFPRDAWVMTVLYFFGLFIYNLPGHPSIFGQTADFITAYTGTTVVKWLLWTISGLHSLESIYMYSLCRRHSTGFALGAMYVVSTFFGGFPTWVNLRKKIQAARIDSVMKIQ